MLVVRETSLVSTPFTSGGDNVGGRADSGSQALALAIQVNLWAAPPFDFDWPCLPKSCSSTCSKPVNYHFKEVPRKGYPFEQNASIHTSKEKPDIGLWEGMATTKAWKKVLSSNSYFPKPIDIRWALYHDKGNRLVNGVSLILLNRWQIFVNAYVHNYAWVLSTVWLNRSDNILVSCLVISSV